MSGQTENREGGEKGEPAAKPTVRERLRGAFGRVSGWVNGPYRAAAFAGLLALLVFFGRDILSTLRVGADIRRLRSQKRELMQSIAADSTLLRNLDDPEFLERYARERYLMRREGDEVYILKD
ncbi:MAG: septum formation initiator family protein [Alistipes sp.]|jgi:cell division protein FtsB|nr:septum formation initiator family protein [Alistipes sp.]